MTGSGASSSAACPAIIAWRTRRCCSTRPSSEFARATLSKQESGIHFCGPCGKKPAMKSAMKPATPRLTDFRRIVVKIGSSLLVDAKGGRLNEKWLASLAADIAALHAEKHDILVVSS